MSDLGDDILRRRREADQEKQFQLEKSRAINDKIGTLFGTLKEHAKRCIDKLRTDRSYSLLSFENGNMCGFTVTNLAYPYAKVEVQLGTQCFRFNATTRATENAPIQHQSDHIDVTLDDQWAHLMMSHGGVTLTPEQALAIILKPAIDR